MIKPEELRVGNRVLVNRYEDDDPWETTVEEIEAMHITASLVPRGGTWVKYEDLNPIPLTPEWLERCGLPCDRSTIDAGGNFSLVFERREDKLFLVSSSAMESEVIRQIEYVHIFQNIYFDLKCEELQIKLP
jgi:hypothetical protein